MTKETFQESAKNILLLIQLKIIFRYVKKIPKVYFVYT